MPKGKWKKCFYSKDPFLPIFYTKTDGRKEPEYYEEIAYLIHLLAETRAVAINYAHVNLNIPKDKLPLSFEGNHMDISYITPDGNLCFIQFHIIPYRRLPKKYLKVIR